MTAPLWIFGYGSLLWNPGFCVAETRIARLHDWHRSFCMSSIHHRGTEADPGLVLALDALQGASCDGLALRAEPGTEDATIAYLRERELISSAYVETRQTVNFHDGGTQDDVLTYVINRDHVQYCQHALEVQARIIAGAVGGRGPNDEYLYNTAAHLSELGIGDADLEALVTMVRDLKAAL
ncbi:gamma-glutamylcyclotransferase [Rhodobacteraceae bacterium N5(2021)]|uniref:glutathione-specific gamma-glutamylcyclotransferase n=1 Tax=Gymnodinialimonas phycosphaerae TaxID=2841589 RepID=A0A975TUD3_9RHOB|nr:gamma-glutamylcyclotransferase [Gymnodinialimonas phycosphaerae]MBY4895082.1 gamma-glutamylcyclotransferase [Gymnodinialimonas phycosphaerae]